MLLSGWFLVIEVEANWKITKNFCLHIFYLQIR